MGGFIPYSAIPNTQAGTHELSHPPTSSPAHLTQYDSKWARGHLKREIIVSSRISKRKVQNGRLQSERGPLRVKGVAFPTFSLLFFAYVSRSHYPCLRACSTVVICYLNCIWLRDYYLSVGCDSQRGTFAGYHTILFREFII